MAARASPIPDAPPANWLDRFAPDWLKPYGRLARWDRPIGWQLLMWPCWWAAALAGIAADRAPNIGHLALFLIGAVAMRGAGCTYNDLIDRNIDATVARTRLRPLPSGAVTPLQALVFLALQCLVGLVVLLQFNSYTIQLGFASLLIVGLYPFMKRVTDWPQLVLGMAFSWGALLGWSALFGRMDAAALVLYLGAVFWTVAYDTIYALQDKEDDALVGVRSTARLFGARARAAIAAFYAAAFGTIGVACVLADAGLFAFAGLGAALLHVTALVISLEPDDPANCLARFRANNTTGLVVFAGLLLDSLLRL